MFIKSITLDGFKSYGNRVEITGFDPAFNAITGLNGTGKSNILDSICFVLGITNLSNVRAGSLTELIYKHGQAGITKATVSITFDNRDKAQAPVGYESADEITITRQIVMGGKNKYMINGINVQNKRVSDLFCSVQLNVNNPHFLIMQGRITKVLNMKPPEILSMIEEAAGTSMYETKKQQALNIIAKKDAKLAELDDIIREDIAPRLQKLQDERAHYQEHQKIIREIDGLSKLNQAYKYEMTQKKCAKLEQQIEAAENNIRASEALIKDNQQECKAIEKEIAEMHKIIDAESSGVLQELEETLSAAERQEAAAAAELRAADACVADCDVKLSRDTRAHQADQAVLQTKQAQADQVAASFSGLREASESSAAALTAAQEHFLAVSSGRGDGDRGDVLEQLAAARSEAAEVGTRVAGATMELAALETRLQRLRAELAASAQAYARDQAAVAERERRRQALQSELSALPYDAARHETLVAERRALQDAVRAQRDAVDRLKAQTQRCRFHYNLPHPNFDTRRVHGTVSQLITVVDPSYCTALETTAGSKLFHVVVDTDETSKLVLNTCDRSKRVTIIPLTQMITRVIDAATVAIAQQIGGGAEAVQLALDLVSGSAAVANALRWVFGTTLVCRDLQTAKRVCFHPRVQSRCVTLEGDVYNPSGALSGGAVSQAPSPLQKLVELSVAEPALQEQERRLEAADAEHKALQRASEAYYAHKQRLDMVSHELELLTARMAGSEHANAQAEIGRLEAQVSEIKTAMQRDSTAQPAAAARVAQLEATVEDLDGYRKREYKKAEAALRQAREAANKHSAAWQAHAGELETLQLEVVELEASVAAAQSALAAAAAARAAAVEQRDLAHAAHQATVAEVQSVQDRVARHKEEVALRSRDVGERAARRDALRAAARDAELRRKELTLSLTALRREESALRQGVAALLVEEPWIEAEKQFFGRAGGAYDFAERDAEGAAARLEQLEARRDALARGLNARAHTLHAKEDEQYAELLRKKGIVEADRRKLQETIRSLDEKKRLTLQQAAARVHRDFAAIFSTLLPGASASLAPPPGRAVLDGLEVRVAFNGVWKESLGELSGGQRSLVALALVLAMLRFKPAPLYILDEVDAALDLSHTQNIGLMLRNHFQTSQFIIVSLKDGMFNNANVLFRTRFQDGMSSVQRTVNAGARARAAPAPAPPP